MNKNDTKIIKHPWGIEIIKETRITLQIDTCKTCIYVPPKPNLYLTVNYGMLKVNDGLVYIKGEGLEIKEDKIKLFALNECEVFLI